MDKLYKALYDAAIALLAVTMKQYTDSRAVSTEEVTLCLAISNIDTAKQGPNVNQSEQLRFMAEFGGQMNYIVQTVTAHARSKAAHEDRVRVAAKHLQTAIRGSDIDN